MDKKHIGFDVPWPNLSQFWAFARKWLLPNPGTLVLMVILALAIPALAAPRFAPEATSTSTISYQGRLADSDGNPLTGYYNLEFRIYDAPSGGAPLWEEFWTGGNSVQVSDGLFNVMLGSIDNTLASAIEGHDELYLGITVGTDSEMSPRVQLGSVPFSMQALTVPDGSITTDKIGDGQVTSAKLDIDDGLDVDGILSVSGGAATDITLESDPYNWFLSKVNSGTDFAIYRQGLANILRLQQNGNVGIGTDAPATTLHVRSTDYHTLRLESTHTAGTILEFFPSASGGKTWKIQATADTAGQGPGKLVVFQPPANLGLLTLSDGKVGIGKTSPTASLDINGDFHASGTKSAVVQASKYGQRKLYAIESPEVRFSDEGMARLKDGAARVDLDPVFLETIEGDYLVHVTPYGDAGLFVAEIGPDYFVVQAREGDPNITFAWRLSAYRKGYENVRLEPVGTTD